MPLQAPGTEIPFTNGYYKSGRSLQFSAQRCINYRPNIARRGALSRANLYMTEGVRGVTTTPEGPNRGSEVFDGELYQVNGSKLYKITQTINPDLSETYAYVELGTIGGTGRVIMEPGQSHLVIVIPEQSSWAWDGTTLTQLDGLANFRTAKDVLHINSIFVFLENDSNVVFNSNVNNPLVYNSLDYRTVVQIEDGVGLLKLKNQLYVMGDKQTIPFSYTGATNGFPFQPQPRAEMDIGIRSQFAKINVRQSAVILGGSENEEPGIWLFPQMIKISDESIDYVIQNLTDYDIESAFFMKHSQNDGENVLIVAGDECFAYDLKTDSWHERRSTVNEQDLRWRVNSITRVYNRLIVGDYIDGRVGILDDQVNTEYGNYIKRVVTMQPFDSRGMAVFMSDLLIAMDAGFGGEITLDWSHDGGYNWSNGLALEAGAQGEYGRIVRYTQLGASSFFRVLRLTTTTDKPCNINKIIGR